MAHGLTGNRRPRLTGLDQEQPTSSRFSEDSARTLDLQRASTYDSLYNPPRDLESWRPLPSMYEPNLDTSSYIPNFGRSPALYSPLSYSMPYGSSGLSPISRGSTSAYNNFSPSTNFSTFRTPMPLSANFSSPYNSGFTSAFDSSLSPFGPSRPSGLTGRLRGQVVKDVYTAPGDYSSRKERTNAYNALVGNHTEYDAQGVRITPDYAGHIDEDFKMLLIDTGNASSSKHSESVKRAETTKKLESSLTEEAKLKTYLPKIDELLEELANPSLHTNIDRVEAVKRTRALKKQHLQRLDTLKLRIQRYQERLASA